jgi:hypothetical protein
VGLHTTLGRHKPEQRELTADTREAARVSLENYIRNLCLKAEVLLRTEQPAHSVGGASPNRLSFAECVSGSPDFLADSARDK